MSLLVGLLALVLVIRFLPVALRARELLARRIPQPRAELVPESEVPGDLRALLRRADAWAQPLGFDEVGWVRTQGDPERVRPHEHHRLLRSFDGATYLWVRAEPQPAPGRVLRVTLVTALLDGRLLVSQSGAASEAYLGSGDTVFHDPGSIRHADTVRAHADLVAQCGAASAAEEVTQSGAGARVEEPEAHVAHREREERRAIEEAVGRGIARAREGGEHELRYVAALRIASRQMSALGREVQLLRRRSAECEDRELTPLLSEEVASYEGFEARRQRPSRRFAAPWVLVISGLLFVASFAGFMDPITVLLLAGAVLFHELGHFAAMRAFGYADTRIFFVPFFGGAAAGHKHDAELWQEMIVLLAGPVPGIALGALLVGVWPGALGHPIGSAAIAILIVVNALNLLPIFPLDGGRIVHRLLVRGHPLGEMIFRALAAAIFAAGAFSLGEPLLGFLAVVVMLGTAHAMRVASLERALRAAGGGGSPAAILGYLREHERPLPFSTRMAITFELRGRLSAPEAGVLSRLVWLFVYGAVIALSIVVPLIFLLAGQLGAELLGMS